MLTSLPPCWCLLAACADPTEPEWLKHTLSQLASDLTAAKLGARLRSKCRRKNVRSSDLCNIGICFLPATEPIICRRLAYCWVPQSSTWVIKQIVDIRTGRHPRIFCFGRWSHSQSMFPVCLDTSTRACCRICKGTIRGRCLDSWIFPKRSLPYCSHL